MKIIYILMVFVSVCVLGCFKKIDHFTLKKMLHSDNINQIIEAANYISENKDTVLINELLKKSFDPRITHLLKYQGMSVYQIKMGTMEHLTNLAPPHKLTYRPDSVNIKFYLSVAIKRGWIKKLD